MTIESSRKMRRLNYSIISVSGFILITLGCLIFINYQVSVALELEAKVADMHKAKLMKLKTDNRALQAHLTLARIAAAHSQNLLSEIQRDVKLKDRGGLRPSFSLSHEYDLDPASLFTRERVFPAEFRLGGRVTEKITAKRRLNLQHAIEAAVQHLKLLNASYQEDDFIEGIFHSECVTGSYYELIFKNRSQENGVIKLNILQPLTSFKITAMQNANVRDDTKTIYIILPLAGRLKTFQSFMKRYHKIALYDRHINLLVVYFQDEQLAAVQSVLQSYPLHPKPKLIVLQEKFSRAKALRVGSAQVNTAEDSLLFFCDVDVVFTSRFLDRCRWNTEAGLQVYYPILFSLYNPFIVYKRQGKPIPPEHQQWILSKETGFWRDFGYGMTCQYRSDFERHFDSTLEQTTWGGEDVALYRRFLHDPNIRVLRSTDPGIFHTWHHKSCNTSMTPSHLRACMHSKFRTEGSYDQLGFLAFPDQQIFNQVSNE